MMNIYLEIFGYLGTALVLLSMMMTSVVKLRLFNTVGSVISMIYSFLCGAWPVVFLNLGLIVINVYQLIRLGQSKVVFSHVELGAKDQSLSYFLELYKGDISKFFPAFHYQPDENTEVHMVYTGAEPVGVLIGKRAGDDLNVELDYATTKYRDCSVAEFLFSSLKKGGVRRLIAHRSSNDHNQYLTKMGFKSTDGIEIKEL
jgi:hypothetical protein